MSTAPPLDTLLAGAQLPALPQSAIRLLELSQDPDNGPAEFAVPIEADPGLTGQVLRFVNSSYFGFSREISSVKLAITLVGVRTVKNFALWSAVFSLMPNPKCGSFNLKNLWQDSLRRAIFARMMGKQLGLKDSEDLFAAALLQDMAVPLLSKEMANEYVKLIDGRDNGQRRLSDLERDRFGWTHAEAAGVMARGWSLPEQFADLVETHLDWQRWTGEEELNPGRVSVSLSGLLPAATDPTWVDQESFEQTYRLLDPGTFSPLAKLFEQVDVQYAEFAPVLKLSSPTTPLVKWLNKADSVEA